MPQEERWLPVPGHESAYEVSSLGQVRRTGSGRGARVGLILKQKLVGDYLYVGLREHNQPRSYTVHRLVCRAFHGEPKTPDLHAAHLDGNPLNCAETNLQWKTRLDNEADKRVHGTLLCGEKHPLATLSDAECIKIFELRKTGISQAAIAQIVGCVQTTVSRILNHKTRKSATERGFSFAK